VRYGIADFILEGHLKFDNLGAYLMLALPSLELKNYLSQTAALLRLNDGYHAVVPEPI